MRISVVVPVRNEAGSIRRLLDSLLSQTRIPDEIVITDGGSTDATAEIIESYIRRGAPVVLIREIAALPGRGRNLAATKASSEWLAFIDAGIRPDLGWLAALSERAEAEEADVVYGAWEPVIDNFFQQCAVIAYVPPPLKRGDSFIRPKFIASALMRKSVWQAAGGFPEDLRSAEDLLFMNRIDGQNFPTAYAPDARVFWHVQPTPWLTFKRFVTYARNNMRAGLGGQWQAPIFKRYAFLFILSLPIFWLGSRWLIVTLGLWLGMLLARAGVAIWRNRNVYPAGFFENAVRMLVLAPLIALLDVATITGTMQWMVKDKLSFSRSTGD